jgi:hypothetical protein
VRLFITAKYFKKNMSVSFSVFDIMPNSVDESIHDRVYSCTSCRDAGTGGQEGQPPPLPFTRRGTRGAKVPFQFKGLPWRNSELSEMLVQFFYEFASENARNPVIELQE